MTNRYSYALEAAFTGLPEGLISFCETAAHHWLQHSVWVTRWESGYARMCVERVLLEVDRDLLEVSWRLEHHVAVEELLVPIFEAWSKDRLANLSEEERFCMLGA